MRTPSSWPAVAAHPRLRTSPGSAATTPTSRCWPLASAARTPAPTPGRRRTPYGQPPTYAVARPPVLARTVRPSKPTYGLSSAAKPDPPAWQVPAASLAGVSHDARQPPPGRRPARVDEPGASSLVRRAIRAVTGRDCWSITRQFQAPRTPPAGRGARGAEPARSGGAGRHRPLPNADQPAAGDAPLLRRRYPIDRCPYLPAGTAPSNHTRLAAPVGAPDWRPARRLGCFHMRPE